MLEFALGARSGGGVVIEMRLLAGDFQMAAAGEAAVDALFVDDFFDEINGFEGSRVHALDEFAAVAFDQRGHGKFQPGEDHAAVAGAGAPAESFGFEERYANASLREGAGGGEAAEAAAYDGDIYFFG